MGSELGRKKSLGGINFEIWPLIEARHEGEAVGEGKKKPLPAARVSAI